MRTVVFLLDSDEALVAAFPHFQVGDVPVFFDDHPMGRLSTVPGEDTVRRVVRDVLGTGDTDAPVALSVARSPAEGGATLLAPPAARSRIDGHSQ